MNQNKKIRVLFTIPNFRTAGSQYVLLSLITRLDRNVYESYVCVENSPELIPKEVPEQNRIVFNWTGNNIMDAINFRKMLMQNQFHILHSWDYKSNFLEALGARLAGVTYLYTKKNNSWTSRWKFKSVLSTHIVFDNPCMEDRFFNTPLFKSKISFIPHGVDLEVFHPLKAFKVKNRKTFNLVSVGNIGVNKNQLFLIKALVDLPSEIVLHLFGNQDKSYKKLLDGFIAINNLSTRVVFHGFVENRDIPNILDHMDLFLLASLKEGLPVSIMEAMACGLPALSSDSGGGTKYILPSENIFSLENTNELVERINYYYKLCDKERQVLMKNQVIYMKSKFDIQSEIQAYSNLYEKLIQR